jgi:hypothetical protein
MLIASPLTLAVALWGMSGPRLFFCTTNFKCCLLPNVYPWIPFFFAGARAIEEAQKTVATSSMVEMARSQINV